MTLAGWLQIILIFVVVVAAAWPLGIGMARLFTRTEPMVFESGLYRLAGVDAHREQSWASYTLAMLSVNLVGFIVLYLLQRLQYYLPLDPQGFAAPSEHLSFNTAISFVTNTNWQSYGGETTLGHFVQMAGLTVQNFLSTATGIALAVALTRAFARSETKTLGNFWVDFTRATVYVLLPLAIIVASLMIALGLPQSLQGSVEATTLEGAKQVIALGPVASQEAIKQLGTNGGGFFNVNAAHPFENPNAWSNYLSIFAMLVVSAAMPVTFGRMVSDIRQGRALLIVMLVMLFAGAAAVYWAESYGNPLLSQFSFTSPANFEGKEVRFGLAMSALYAAVTTGLSCGAVNAMHASLTPLGGLVPMFLIQLGEILPGGVGSGLYGIIVMALISVFVAGLMVGRTPDYLGKKIEGREMKLAVLAILVLPLVILGFTAISAMLPAALSSLANNGPHGLSEILYAFSSATGNNGSAFAGLNANTPWFDTTMGIAMALGRFAYVVPVMAIAGSLGAKKKTPQTLGSFPTHGMMFIGLLIGVILILGGLQYFPALALGPIVEHFAMLAGKTF